jgi:transport and Golgi organization protein 2
MCTVSIVPIADGYRVMCNRDERRTRAVARPPRTFPTEVSWATYPQDPESGGTWIGVNDDGLVLALLNRTPAGSEPCAWPRSRGSVVPALLACPSIPRALNACDEMDLSRLAPFRIVMAHRSILAVVTVDRTRPAAEQFPLVKPMMFTSSSLGDAVVETPRRRLFDELVLAGGDWLHGQFCFHRHRWDTRPEISVQMAREDAATVSRTTIAVTAKTIDVDYESLGGDVQAPPAAYASC